MKFSYFPTIPYMMFYGRDKLIYLKYNELYFHSLSNQCDNTSETILNNTSEKGSTSLS